MTLNQNHIQLNGLKIHLQGGHGLGPDFHDAVLIEKSVRSKKNKENSATFSPKHRPMVQYFPDNVRKSHNSDANEQDNFIESVPLSNDVSDLMDSRIEKKVQNVSYKINYNNIQPSKRAHIFYYAWYADIATDGNWQHWNHEYLPNWKKRDKKHYPTGKHNPNASDIGASFYPELGPYSSRNIEVISKHMHMMSQNQIGVLVLSWYPPGLSDPNGRSVDEIVPKLLDEADKVGIKLALHIEPFEGRDANSLRQNLTYVHATYGSHPAFYKWKGKPMYYIYDSYMVSAKEWARLLRPDGDITIRGTKLDAYVIGLLVEQKHKNDLKFGGFDGFYTYFGANGFSFGSTWKNWRSLASFARKHSMIFIPSVSPGYNDIRVRPWNGQNTRLRRKGAYYDIAWRSFMELSLRFVSITSFNEWHEGTQIEPAIPCSIDKYTYNSYLPLEPAYYLLKTREWIQSFMSDLEKQS